MVFADCGQRLPQASQTRHFGAVAIGGLFRAIAADRHAAPATGVAAGMVGEQQGARRSFASLDVREVLIADKFRKGCTDRLQQRLGGSPAPRRVQSEGPIATTLKRDLGEGFIASKKAIQWFKVLQVIGAQGFSSPAFNKAPEPFPQAPSLGRDAVQFTEHGLGAQARQLFGVNQLRLAQPIEQALAIGDPINRRIDGSRDRIQKIQCNRIGDEDGGRGGHSSFLQAETHGYTITGQKAVDKLCTDRNNPIR
jgi:hypothetical protein